MVPWMDAQAASSTLNVYSSRGSVDGGSGMQDS